MQFMNGSRYPNGAIAKNRGPKSTANFNVDVVALVVYLQATYKYYPQLDDIRRVFAESLSPLDGDIRNLLASKEKIKSPTPLQCAIAGALYVGHGPDGAYLPTAAIDALFATRPRDERKVEFAEALLAVLEDHLAAKVDEKENDSPQSHWPTPVTAPSEAAFDVRPSRPLSVQETHFNRSNSKRAPVLAAALGLVVVLGTVGIVVTTESSDSRASLSTTSRTPSSEIETTLSTTSSTSTPTSSFRVDPYHRCLNPNPSTEAPDRPELCVIAWCTGKPLNADGTENEQTSFIKMRPRIVNTSSKPLDLNITGVSAMRLLVRQSDMPGSWQPPPVTAAAGDRPLLVEWERIKYWAVPPNLPNEPIAKIPVGPGLVQYQRFATFWDADVIAVGGSYVRPIVQRSSNPQDVIQEADLVFEFPSDSDIFAIAIVDRSDPTNVLTVFEAGKNGELWGPTRMPSTF
ncbi:hypothetical protein [Mycolicibacterium grossiae]|nr:hypothetical protein [Mycolicibacterium grossiae]